MTYDLDLSNQIDNKWYKDTVIAIIGDDFRFSIKMKAEIKKKIKRLFIGKNREHNKKVVALIFAYLITKSLILNKGITKVKICRDHRPENLVYSYIQKTASFLGEPKITENREIKFRKSEIVKGEKIRAEKSKAHRYANKVFKNRKIANYILNKNDYEELAEIIRKII